MSQECLFCEPAQQEPIVPVCRIPVWWKPCKFDGVLSQAELELMANADARFLDEEETTHGA